MSEKFDDIIAGLVSKIAGLVSKAERASASLREYTDHALALRFDREVAIVEFGDWYYFRLMGGDWERAPDFYGRRGIEIDWVEIVRKFCRLHRPETLAIVGKIIALLINNLQVNLGEETNGDKARPSREELEKQLAYWGIKVNIFHGDEGRKPLKLITGNRVDG